MQLNEKAYQRIREMIISLRLAPGSHVDERALKDELSIGRTPVRDSLLRLAAENLLESIPGRGFFVKPINLDDVKALFESLMILERAAILLAARRVDREQLDKMKKIYHQHATATQERDYLRVTLLNSQFHKVIYEATHNVFLQTALNGIQDQAQRVAYLTYTKEAHPSGMEFYNQKAIQDHEQIILGLDRGDWQDVVKVMTEHIKRFYIRICRYMGPRTESFDPLIEGIMDLEGQQAPQGA
jgi:DNA-binding GntR family transcriptional regulator